ncbi:SCP2 domain-containing protein [Bowmanella yangjiangensis]|uniref:Ubiquinone biosynthesis accessory factor UbiJ n=1 Tax=Bowmanella yangjiangensis TaxID=2811230 RepID=A0ABS3CYT0_9ALTE|nr:SCP2 sterol-binding domain-containing protein [Bowmanella yangjiangensis]MBN7820764.1 SCP2 sterol-binding domain-containing protein [Bowmanella yangjiangensis]
MPMPQLLAGALELALNKVLALDPNSQKRLAELDGKRMRIKLQEMPWPLTFVFSSRIDVLMDQEQPVDCAMALSLSHLNEMQDPANISALIQDKKLSLNGDMHTAQSFAALMKELDIDWEEHISRYTGDVIAHESVRLVKNIHQRAKSHFLQLGQIIKDGALQEKQLVPHPLAIEDFSQEVNRLRADTARFEARLNQLEQRAKR